MKAEFDLTMVAGHVWSAPIYQCIPPGRKVAHGALHEVLAPQSHVWGDFRKKGRWAETALAGSSLQQQASPKPMNAALKPQGENKGWKCTCGWQHIDGLVQSLAKQGVCAVVQNIELLYCFNKETVVIYRKRGKKFILHCVRIFLYF